MLDLIRDVSADVVANIVLGATVLIGIAAYHVPRRRRMRRFFSLDGSGEVAILLSNIWVDRSRGVTPMRTGYQGPAGSLGEYQSASALAEAIERDSGVPRVLQFFISSRGDGPRRYSQAKVEIKLGPDYIDPRDPTAFTPVREFKDLPADVRRRTMDEIASGRTLVLVGAHIFNPAVLFVTEGLSRDTNPHAGVTFVDVEDPTSPNGTRRAIRTPAGDFVRGSINDAVYREYCLVQRVHGWPEPHSTLFLCSGFSTVSTGEALLKLRDWDQLRRAAGGDRSFAAVYEVTGMTRLQADDETVIGTNTLRLVYMSPPEEHRPRVDIPQQRTGGADSRGVSLAGGQPA